MFSKIFILQTSKYMCIWLYVYFVIKNVCLETKMIVEKAVIGILSFFVKGRTIS